MGVTKFKMPGGVFPSGIALVFYSETAKRQKVFYSKTESKYLCCFACKNEIKSIVLQQQMK